MALAIVFWPFAYGQTPGQELWSFPTGDVVFSSPAVGDDGTIYVGSENNNLYAINPSGTQKWVFIGATDWIDSSPAIGSDGTIYVGSWDNNLYAINPANGSQIWKFETDSLIIASPAIGADGTIYFGSSDATFYALNSNGTKQWEFLTTDELDSSPATAADGTIYFGSYEGNLYALNPDGSLKWTFSVDVVEGEDSRISSSPAIDFDGNIYFGSGNNRLYSVDPSGTERWSFTAGGNVDSSPVIGVDGTVYFASRDGYIYVLDEFGIEDFSILVGDVFFSSPILDDAGNFYITSFVGGGTSKVFAFREDGGFLWEFAISDLVDSSPTIAPNGALYIGGFDGRLYAIHAGNGLANSFWPQFSHDPKHTGLGADKQTPVITWSDSPDIVVGTNLSGVQLNAMANVAGSFEYVPPTGTVLALGEGQVLSTTFNPNDTQTYRSVTAQVLIDVVATDVFDGVILGDNFFFSAWFGIYNVTFYPWIFHVEHGWQYVFETGNQGEAWLFDNESIDFWWTSSSFQSLTFWSNTRQTFNFYFVGTTDPRDFVDLETEEFWTIP